MSKVEKISIALTQNMLATVRDAVASGRYASSSEVVREALRDWTARRDQETLAEELHRAIVEGHASGSAPYDGIGAIRDEGRRRLAQLQTDAQ